MWRLEKGATKKSPVTANVLDVPLRVVCGTCKVNLHYLKLSLAVGYRPSYWCAERGATSPEVTGNEEKSNDCKGHPIHAHPKPSQRPEGLQRGGGGPRSHTPQRAHLRSSSPPCACAWASWACHAGRWSRTGRRSSHTRWGSRSSAAPTRLPRVLPPAASLP